MNAPLARPLVFHPPGDNELARRLRGAVRGEVLAAAALQVGLEALRVHRVVHDIYGAFHPEGLDRLIVHQGIDRAARHVTLADGVVVSADAG